MPHLSPMLWTLALIIFTLNLLLLTSAAWWSQTPQFPDIKHPMPPQNIWQWN